MKVVFRLPIDQWSIIFLSNKEYKILPDKDTIKFFRLILPNCGDLIELQIFTDLVKKRCEETLKDRLKNIVIRPTNKELVLFIE